MKLNLFEITVPPKVKRIYYHNSQTEPEIMTSNLSRVNNIRFISSADLVWIELLPIETEILPHEIDNYKKGEEIIENDEKLFIRTFYSHIGKLFKDNGFLSAGINLYMHPNSKSFLEKNQEISYYETYKLKVYKIDSKTYLSINPRFTFLSTKPAIESRIRSNFVLNIKSGRSFPFVSADDGKLVISVSETADKEVKYPENYYFNFTTRQAEELGFSKELYQIYNEKIRTLYSKIQSSLSFLRKIANLDKAYELDPKHAERVVAFYKFSGGNSDEVKKIFDLKPLKNGQSLKMTFLFPSKYKVENIEEPVKKVFASSNSEFFKSLYELGFSKIEYLRDPQTNKVLFYYDENTFDIEKTDFLASAGKVYAIVF